MGTNTPAVREHDFPITEPYKPPKALPEVSPDRIVQPMKPVPAREPVPVRREGADG